MLSRFDWGEDPLYDHPASPAALLDVVNVKERVLLFALAGWARPVEACSTSTSSLSIPKRATSPTSDADERKNTRRTRNTVELLIGIDAVREQIDPLVEYADWTRYLLPGKSVERPISTQTTQRWFLNPANAPTYHQWSYPLSKMGCRT
ncbi:hypothetical protein [Halarchaeum salinum]